MTFCILLESFGAYNWRNDARNMKHHNVTTPQTYKLRDASVKVNSCLMPTLKIIHINPIYNKLVLLTVWDVRGWEVVGRLRP